MTERRILDEHHWKEGLFGCCSDLSTCCYGCFCTACLFGENVRKTSTDAGFFGGCCGYCLTQAGCCCLVHKPARIRFREAYGLKEGHGFADDFWASWCCSACGVCQEAREIKSQGKPPMVTVVAHVGTQPTAVGNRPR